MEIYFTFLRSQTVNDVPIKYLDRNLPILNHLECYSPSHSEKNNAFTILFYIYFYIYTYSYMCMRHVWIVIMYD
jgi:hypothetical protein